MGINGIETAGYPVTGYTNNIVTKAETGKNFADTITEKVETSKRDYDEEAFNMVGANAPQSVKDAWMETVKEVGINGLGMTSNGSTHITQMHIQQVIAHYYGRDYTNILGNSVQSAIQATQKALYDFDHPLEPNKVRSLEEQQARIKERQFYVTFLEKLEKATILK